MENPKNLQAIAVELQKMVDEDQEMRNRGTHKPEDWDETVDRRNTERMKAIIDEIGWPSISKVGYQGSSNAWLLVQHADHDPAFQSHCLALIKTQPENEVIKRDIAYLEDRVAVAQKKPQIYGTQFHYDTDKQLKPLPIQDPDNVDARRKEMGLDTLQEYEERMRKSYGDQRPGK